jgi:hypothetical protein
MPKDDGPGTGLDVKQIYPLPDVSPPGQIQMPNNNGYVVVPNGSNPIFVVPQPASQPTASQPSVVVLTVGAKDEKKDKKTEISSVFQRL